MILLYQFAPTWGIPNLGAFNVKVETYLRIAGIPYRTVNTLPLKGPKGKLPFIDDDGEIIADSQFIIEYLKNKYGESIDVEMSAEQRAMMLAMQRLVEEHLYWVEMHARWFYRDENWQLMKQSIFAGAPWLLRGLVALTYRRFVIRKQIYGQGLGRHNDDEIFQLGRADVDALAGFLADKPYLMGQKPSSLDASAFGLLVNIIRSPIESPIKDYALSQQNLTDYCDRMMAEYFPELAKKVEKHGNSGA